MKRLVYLSHYYDGNQDQNNLTSYQRIGRY